MSVRGGSTFRRQDGGTRPLGDSTVADRIAQESCPALGTVIATRTRLPASRVSPRTALKAISRSIRGWALSPSQRQVPCKDLAAIYNPYIQGWINLRPVLSKAASGPDAAAHRQTYPEVPLGALEVQAPARAAEGSKRMVGPGSPRQSNALLQLAVLQCRQPNIGSRVNREVSARF